jgi:hypothetical protein
MKAINKVLLVLVFFFISQASLIAQCAMCRAGIENNVSNGDTTIGAGLNMGILYLLSMPYLLALILGYLWYKNAKNRKGKFRFQGDKY